MLVFDAHLDLSLNALQYNRDLRLSVPEIRAAETGMSDLAGRGCGTVAFPEMRKGGDWYLCGHVTGWMHETGWSCGDVELTTASVGHDPRAIGMVPSNGGGTAIAPHSQST